MTCKTQQATIAFGFYFLNVTMKCNLMPNLLHPGGSTKKKQTGLSKVQKLSYIQTQLM